MESSCNDSGNLSLSCSVSSVEGEESEVEGDLETVEVHQFEPVQLVIHQQSQITEAEDDDSGDEDSAAAGIIYYVYA